jgi:DNA helicase-2/ATP-dependent DNA helicase PcrA
MSDGDGFPETLLSGLTLEQREAVTSTARRLLVRASAGSGKTHVLTLRIQRRIASGELDADHVLAMTFTRRAGDQLRQRLRRAGVRDVRAGTFHRAALGIVNQFRADHGLAPAVIEANRRRLVATLASRLREDGGVRLEEWQLPRVELEIGWALSQGLSGSSYARRAQRQRRQSPLPAAQFADLLDRYVGLCRSKGVLDFDLLLGEATALLREEPAVRAAFRHRTRAIFVDEAQDMNPLQFDLLRQMAGEDPDLFCVGDPNQSIYGFNGASAQLLASILDTWPDTTVLDLTRNHRSTAHIVAVANTLLESGVVGISPAKQDGDLPLVRAFDTDAEEAERVVQWLRSNRQPGSPWRSMAVLARTNAQLEPFADALTRAEVPFERLGAEHSPASDLVTETDPRARFANREAPNAVALSTFHRAKGLEWQHVAVVGFAEGLLPHYNATSEAALAEEQRLAYVALSRAESTLLITWSRGRGDPRRPERAPSRFLAPVERALAERARALAPLAGEDRRARIAAIRRDLERASAAVAWPDSGDRRPS